MSLSYPVASLSTENALLVSGRVTYMFEVIKSFLLKVNTSLVTIWKKNVYINYVYKNFSSI